MSPSSARASTADRPMACEIGMPIARHTVRRPQQDRHDHSAAWALTAHGRRDGDLSTCRRASSTAPTGMAA